MKDSAIYAAKTVGKKYGVDVSEHVSQVVKGSDKPLKMVDTVHAAIMQALRIKK